MTIRPEFNNGGVIEAVSIALFKFLLLFRWFRWFRFGISVVLFWCFGVSGGFVSVFRVLVLVIRMLVNLSLI